MTIESFCSGKTVACEPFTTTGVETEIRHGMGTIKQKVTLTALEVVFFGCGLNPGDIVYTRGVNNKANWGKEIFEVGGRKIILVPDSDILLVERLESSTYEERRSKELEALDKEAAENFVSLTTERDN